MKRWQALFALAGLLFLGVAGGALGTHLYYARFLAEPHGPPSLAGPWFSRQLTFELDLDPEQQRRIEGILAEAHREAEGLRREVGPRLRAIMESHEVRIRELLTPEQLVRYDALRHRFDHRTDRFLEGRRSRFPHRPRHDRIP